MGPTKSSSSKKRPELTDHAVTLRRRLHDALILGIRTHENRDRKWQSTDAEVQSHALRAMTAFIGCVSSPLAHHPLVKESVSDMLLALEGILGSENNKILSQAVNVTIELVSCFGTSLRHVQVLGVFVSLARLLSLCQFPLLFSCAIAVNGIILKRGIMRVDEEKEVWEVLEKSQVITSIVRGLVDYTDGIQPPEYFTELASLLKTILWRWTSSRCRVWSNSKLMAKLEDYFPNPDVSIAVCVLQLLSALALCGDGAMMILRNKGIMSKVVLGMESFQPCNVRCETLILCRHLTRSAEGCSMLTSLYCEPIVQGIICALSGWRSCSKKVPTDQMMLLKEACRTASLTRWAGTHHSYFWNLEIDIVLVGILLGNCSEVYQTQSAFSSEELIAKINDSSTDLRPYIWDILGWLAIHCEEDFLPKTKERLRAVDIIISCACSVAKDLMRNRKTPLSLSTSELEPVSRAVLMMVFSPCNYISSQARYYLLEMRTGDDGYLEYLLTSLKLKATGKVSLFFDSLQTVVNLITLACYSTVPQYQKLILEQQGIQILCGILNKCFYKDVLISRSSIASHLNTTAERRMCCWKNVGDWDEGDINFLYSLQALSQLMLSPADVCKHHEVTPRDIIGCKYCGNSETRDLVKVLKQILDNNFNFSTGVRWYAAYILSFFDFYGFSSSLGQRMKKALDENEVADLKLVLATGQTHTVHGAILVARCPYLLPYEKLLKARTHDLESNKEHETKHGKSYRGEIRMSDRVNYHALVKILEYIYTGTFRNENEHLKSLRLLAKSCGLKSLSDMLARKLPRWGTAIASCDFTQALGPDGYSFSDIVLEAKAAAGVASDCNNCQLSIPHMHAHKIILWSSCDYLRALFQSGMHDSNSRVIKVPVGWLALVKLVAWFYSGKLPRVNLGCLWNNMEVEQQLLEMQAYIELSSLAEYWFLEEVGDDSMNTVVSCITSNQKLSSEIIQFAVELGQWKIVKAAVHSLGPFYPTMRDSGELEDFNEEVVDMLRAKYVCLLAGEY